jgi:hypothetical protein
MVWPLIRVGRQMGRLTQSRQQTKGWVQIVTELV